MLVYRTKKKNSVSFPTLEINSKYMSVQNKKSLNQSEVIIHSNFQPLRENSEDLSNILQALQRKRKSISSFLNYNNYQKRMIPPRLLTLPKQQLSPSIRKINTIQYNSLQHYQDPRTFITRTKDIRSFCEKMKQNKIYCQQYRECRYRGSQDHNLSIKEIKLANPVKAKLEKPKKQQILKVLQKTYGLKSRERKLRETMKIQPWESKESSQMGENYYSLPN